MSLSIRSLFGVIFLFATQATFANTLLPIADCTDLQNIGDNPYADYYLENPIDCKSIDFTPIALFAGTLDGRDKIIDGLTITADPQKPGALFEKVQDATIQNLQFKNAVVFADDDTRRGLLAGHIVSSTVSNIKVDGLTIPVQSTPSSIKSNSLSGQTGGIAANVENTTFTGIHLHNATLSLHTFSGGIIGVTNGATLNNSSVRNVVSLVDPARSYLVSHNNWYQDSGFGGLIGHVQTNATFTIYSSSTTGDIIVPLNAGGLIGLIGENVTGTISNSYSHTNVESQWLAGGLIGQADYWYSGTKIKVDHSYAAGKVDTPQHQGARAIVGNRSKDGTHNNYVTGAGAQAFYDQGATGRKYSGDHGFTSRSTSEMKNNPDEKFSIKNGWSRGVWAFPANDYPVLLSDQ